MSGTWKIGAAVAVGGAAGAVARSLVNGWIDAPWPIATLVVNIVGSFILGTLTGYSLKKPVDDTLKAAIGTGFCGGLTTMSTFSKEAVQLVINGHLWSSFTYVSMSLASGLIAGWGGLAICSRQWRQKGGTA
ncbi:fluoride efflux transporter CrcB [Anoxybacteroides tepidamans]|uniref:fluoride efflux transporter CrcB n=1 Tax=Anoxybacteroides tepidamans TaxID=265948 RepID=UPI00048235C1|nr:fluoride efflux transporter CrcB [Anoxybacillus tepidamans]